MRIGIDLDNTIICYDRSFYEVGLDRGLIPAQLEPTKKAVKTWIQREHGNDAWTQLQGEVYGDYLHKAVPFPGILEFVSQCRHAGHSLRIESHKTQFPAIGKKVDLRQAALKWLGDTGFFSEAGLSRNDVAFHDSRADKVAAITSNAYDLFIDDLEEVFHEPGFPISTTGILFDPNSSENQSLRLIRIKSWEEIREMVFAKDTLNREITLATKLLTRAQLPQSRLIVPLAGGRNNKVFRVATSAGDFLLKSYFHDSQDQRDRLGQEFAFLNHMTRLRSRFCPKPLASVRGEHVGLLEFIQGDRLRLDQVNEQHIDQASAFILEANRENDHPSTSEIPFASEACFSIAQHLDCTQKRIDRLGQILLEDDVDHDARRFVDVELIPAWKATRANIERTPNLELELPKSERCISPSDFGFHNALLEEGGAMRFLDFEYAGWDDPAKLIIDFANQPDMLLEEHLSDRFSRAIIETNTNPDALKRRVSLLEPLYKIKWACICLNIFLAAGRRRLQFTDGAKADHRERRIFQLSRARVMLARAIGKN